MKQQESINFVRTIHFLVLVAAKTDNIHTEFFTKQFYNPGFSIKLASTKLGLQPKFCLGMIFPSVPL